MPSLMAFVKTNTVLLSMGGMSYIAHNALPYAPLSLPCIMFLKNMILLYGLDNYSLSQPKIGNHPGNIRYTKNTYFNVAKASLAESVVLISSPHRISSKLDIPLFIPASFIYEVLFDLFHYVTHRLGHTRQLYRFHKKHHRATSNISAENTFSASFVDLIATNTVPLLLTSYIFPLSELQLYIFMVYKTFIEISGHLGVYIKGHSFPQCVWLVNHLNCYLTIKDHYIHHTESKYNFSKRFSLWDKVFNTYKYDREANQGSHIYLFVFIGMLYFALQIFYIII